MGFGQITGSAQIVASERTGGADRRQFIAIVGGMGLVTITGLRSLPARADTGKVTVLTWETYHDDDWAAAYTKKSGVQVNVVRAGSVDEMYAITRAGSVKPDVIYFLIIRDNPPVAR